MITVTAELTEEQRRQILHLVAAADRVDGFSALNEAGLLALRHPAGDVCHLVATEAGELVGYAQLHHDRPTSTGELVVAPGRRGQGVGHQLLVALVGQARSPLQIWAIGDSAAARRLAEREGFHRVRELLIMRRRLVQLPPTPPLPAGVRIRTFEVGRDETSWLRLNAVAFAHHPEQGRLTRADLAVRLAEDWFDPAGFFLAERGQELVGFHWTKQHPGRLGEVYVLGVDPTAGGGGLGRALLVHGLQHLAAVGNTEVELYVEADHERAVRLYSGYGFEVTNRDVMYALQDSLDGNGPHTMQTQTLQES
ncbi:mycothiol synthase [Microlunatus panaciterrae]|uniref:Mycothiol acetyltransferase n=1 Tax=Microlunatus panaciterrae TaxID=400768 RepID=A0ABS2RH59_9ACTN|nr:mycothiol synthase [Microlunatus panaciterrae]MBM7798345.1 mycothiol synthase [Microlunatus panaciterrae]